MEGVGGGGEGCEGGGVNTERGNEEWEGCEGGRGEE